SWILLASSVASGVASVSPPAVPVASSPALAAPAAVADVPATEVMGCAHAATAISCTPTPNPMDVVRFIQSSLLRGRPREDDAAIGDQRKQDCEDHQNGWDEDHPLEGQERSGRPRHRLHDDQARA